MGGAPPGHETWCLRSERGVEPRALGHRVVVVKVGVVGIDGRDPALRICEVTTRTTQVLGSTERRVIDVMGVGDSITAPVDSRERPRARNELHRPPARSHTASPSSAPASVSRMTSVPSPFRGIPMISGSARPDAVIAPAKIVP